MTSIISTQSSLARPSAVISRTMTDRERIALGTGELIAVIDPREVAPEYSRLTLRDRISARPVQFRGGALENALNGNPALVFENVDNEYGDISLQIPESYFVAVVVDITGVSNTSAFLTSIPPSGNRVFFGALTNGTLRLEHGIGAGIQAPGSAGLHVIWGSHDSRTGSSEIGADAVTAAASGIISTPHMGSASSAVFGGAAAFGVDGVVGPMLIGGRYLGGESNYSVREALLGWLAEYGGVDLAT